MRTLAKNYTKLVVLNYEGEEKRKIGDLYTSETIVKYSKPITFMGHISGARGNSQVEVFGTDTNYDKTLVLSKRKFDELKLTENSVFFVDKKVEYKDDAPLYNYRVSRIAETINYVVVALVKV